jgi:gamma-glutamyltranspeptidase/glutathione hydrolase
MLNPVVRLISSPARQRLQSGGRSSQRGFRAALLFATLSAAIAGRAQLPLPVAAESTQGMVVSAHHLATTTGAEVLARGGNAVDAAVATGLALSVVYPQAGNLGGGGFMLLRLADGRALVIDYRETAPAAASRDLYLAPDGTVLQGEGSSTVGWRAAGVPGTVAGLAHAWEHYGSGRLTWAELVEPARRLAAEGHDVSAAQARRLRLSADHLARYPDSLAIYLAGGRGLEAGEHWRQPELAATLARLQNAGPREFYTGETARRIVTGMQAHDGLISAADLAHYQPVERPPLRALYHGHEILTMPPPSSGGIALLQMLGMLDAAELRESGLRSAAYYHRLAEVMKRAFRDRAEYPGDPAFVAVPMSELLDPAYLRARLADFSPERATPAAALAPGLEPRPTETMETTHFSVVDAAGNAVANTYTLNGNFGSGVTVPGTGILLNNEMDDFTVRAGTPNMFGLIQGEANVIAPGKRPLSSMTPTIVLRDDRLRLVTGSPGGPTIINTVLQVILNVLVHELTPAEAVAAPRIHHQWLPDILTYESGGLDRTVIGELSNRGHRVVARDSYEGATQGDAATIVVDSVTGRSYGVADPRRPDATASGP